MKAGIVLQEHKGTIMYTVGVWYRYSSTNSMYLDPLIVCFTSARSVLPEALIHPNTMTELPSEQREKNVLLLNCRSYQYLFRLSRSCKWIFLIRKITMFYSKFQWAFCSANSTRFFLWTSVRSIVLFICSYMNCPLHWNLSQSVWRVTGRLNIWRKN